MRFVQVNGTTLHVQRDGDVGGTTLVFVNALGTDLRLWTRLGRYLTDRFAVVRYDQRGHGLSGIGTPPYTIDALADDLAGLLDQLDTGPVVVCGLSIGGMVAMGLAAARPDLVRGLVLMDTAPRIATAAIWQERQDTVASGGIDALADAVLERWFPADFRSRHPAELEGWRAMLTRTPEAGYLGCCAALAAADLTAAAAAIRVPTSCLVGEHDGSTPPEQVRALAAAIPGARFAIVRDAGHLPCIDQPGAVAAELLAFLERNGWA